MTFSPGCSRPSIALQVQNRGFKHHSFIHSHHVTSSLSPSGSSPRAPGVGIRLNQQQPKPPLRMAYPRTASMDGNNLDRHKAKCEKFRTLLEASTLNIGNVKPVCI